MLGKPFQVVNKSSSTGEVRMDHDVGPLHILLAEKRGSFDLIQYVSNSTNLRELLGGVCLS